MKSAEYPQQQGKCGGAYRKVVVGVAIAIAAVAAVYLVYFRHGSPDDIMAANMARRAHPRTGGGRQMAFDYYDYEDYEDEEDTAALTPKAAKKKWDKWIYRNNHVSIGELYNKCDGDDRLMVGKVIMQADKVHGGVKSTTYLNHTIEFELTSGEMYIEVQYNGKDLYSNHWELCTVEEGMEDRIIFCPIAPGKKNYVKDLPIPSYLPKGRYTTKAWMTDQDENILGCAFSEFSL